MRETAKTVLSLLWQHSSLQRCCPMELGNSARYMHIAKIPRSVLIGGTEEEGLS